MAQFDEHVLIHVPRWTARLRPPVDVAEVQQQLRERLFIGARPRIAEYSGRGPLGAWVRVAAVRLALKAQRPSDTRDGEQLPAVLDDPELTLLEKRYRDAFAQAVRQALAELDERERVLLRLHLVDSVTLPQLAAIYAVDRATVVRWLAAARQQIRERVLATLRARDGASDDELHSLLKLIRSRLDVSLGGLLRHDDLPER